MTVKMEDISENLHGLIKIIGMENFLKVSKALGGSSIYIPIYKNVQMAERNRQITKEYNGKNTKERSKKNNITKKQKKYFNECFIIYINNITSFNVD